MTDCPQLTAFIYFSIVHPPSHTSSFCSFLLQSLKTPIDLDDMANVAGGGAVDYGRARKVRMGDESDNLLLFVKPTQEVELKREVDHVTNRKNRYKAEVKKQQGNFQKEKNEILKWIQVSVFEDYRVVCLGAVSLGGSLCIEKKK